MARVLQAISIFFLLAAATGSTLAAPGDRGWRDQARADRQQRYAERREFQMRRETERRVEPRADSRVLPGSVGRPGAWSGRPAEANSRADSRPAGVPPGNFNGRTGGNFGAPPGPGRLSPEERRALRRQIEEARDLYPPRR